jgi:hypothetical protein
MGILLAKTLAKSDGSAARKGGGTSAVVHQEYKSVAAAEAFDQVQEDPLKDFVNAERLRGFSGNQREAAQLFVEVFGAAAARFEDEDGHGDAHHDAE